MPFTMSFIAGGKIGLGQKWNKFDTDTWGTNQPDNREPNWVRKGHAATRGFHRKNQLTR